MHIYDHGLSIDIVSDKAGLRWKTFQKVHLTTILCKPYLRVFVWFKIKFLDTINSQLSAELGMELQTADFTDNGRNRQK